MVRPSDLYNGNPYSQNDVFILNRAQNSLNSLRPTWPSDTYLCIGNLTIIGSDNGLSPGWCQANIWTIAGILLIGPLGTHFSEILIEIYTFSFKKMHFKQSFCEMTAILSLAQCVNETGPYFPNQHVMKTCYLQVRYYGAINQGVPQGSELLPWGLADWPWDIDCLTVSSKILAQQQAATVSPFHTLKEQPLGGQVAVMSLETDQNSPLLLTHWGQDKMDAISQTTLSNTFSWMKMLEFWLKFH